MSHKLNASITLFILILISVPQFLAGEWQRDLPQTIALLFSPGLLLWGALNRFKITPLFFAAASPLALLEWFYSYGVVGPVGVGLVMLLAANRIISTGPPAKEQPDLKSAQGQWRLLAAAIIVACILWLLARNDSLALPIVSNSATLTWSALFAPVLAALVFIELSAWLKRTLDQSSRSHLLNWLTLVGVALWLVFSKVQQHEYFYFFFGPSTHLVHPAFGAALLLASIILILALLRFLALKMAICALLVITVLVIEPPLLALTGPSLWATTNPLVMAALAFLFAGSRNSMQSTPALLGDRFAKRLACVTYLVAILAIISFTSYYLVILESERQNDGIHIAPLNRSLVLQLIIAEDLVFPIHAGVDFARLKWLLRDFSRTGKLDRGASTITMQLAKLLYTGDERTVLRKAKQILAAFAIEQRSSKSQILSRYLEAVPFAPGVKGITAASEHFFGVSPGQLTPEQELALIMTIENPMRYSPAQPLWGSVVATRASTVRARLKKFGPQLERAVRLEQSMRF